MDLLTEWFGPICALLPKPVLLADPTSPQRLTWLCHGKVHWFNSVECSSRLGKPERAPIFVQHNAPAALA